MNRSAIRSEFTANEFLSTQPAQHAWQQPSKNKYQPRQVSLVARILSALF